ncbi:hypothetical protein [Oerskovia flava]|uniref:restriction endonuclease subunit S n=1 Tax=Oerskovia flava TaxID=2986422 RepID=UPI00224041D8|nr:hypothetical protein [Oerskovia sp. JB1-3-2]
MAEWPLTTVGEHVARSREKVSVEPETEYDTMGVRWYGKGAYLRPPSRPKTKSLGIARESDFVFCRIDAQNGPFAVVPPELDGALATNEFPLYKVDPDALDSRFLVLCFSNRATLDQIDGLREGRDGRARWKEPDFEAWQVPHPPVPVQKRIVTVISAVDKTIGALEGEIEATGAVRAALLHELLQRRDETWEDLPVGKLGPLTRGKRFVKADYVPEGIGCIHYSQIHTDFGAYTREVVSHLPETMRSRLRFAEPGDLVIAGTSENVEGVLKAVAWCGEEPVAVHDDAYILNHSLEPRFAAYLFASPGLREQVQHVYSDTKVVRVSRDNLARMTVPVPPPAVQAEIADAIDALDRQVAAVAEEVERTRTARSALVEALLSRRVEVADANED